MKEVKLHLGRMRVQLRVFEQYLAKDGDRNFTVVGAVIDEQDRELRSVTLLVDSPDLPETTDPSVPAPEVRCIIHRSTQVAKVEIPK